MTLPIQPRLGNALGFLICAGLVAYALYTQHFLGLEPCPLCIFQRVAVMTLGGLFLLATLFGPGRVRSRVFATVMAVAALAGILIASRHIWIQAQPPGSVAACGADLNYLMDIMPVGQVITKVLTGSGECGKVDWQLLGLSMPWWVAIALAGLGAWAVLINLGEPKRTEWARR